jgi:hypothetical protein
MAHLLFGVWVEAMGKQLSYPQGPVALWSKKTPACREPGRRSISAGEKCLLFIVYSFYTCPSRLSIAMKPTGDVAVFTE